MPDQNKPSPINQNFHYSPRLNLPSPETYPIKADELKRLNEINPDLVGKVIEHVGTEQTHRHTTQSDAMSLAINKHSFLILCLV